MNEKGKMMDVMVVVLRIALGFLFIYASLDKIFKPAEFARVIYNYRLLPVELIDLCAIIVPWLEITLGVCLMLGIWLETASFLVSVLTAAFIIMIASAIFRRLDIECGCFTLNKTGDVISWKRIVEDSLIFGAAIVVFVHTIKTRKIQD